MKLPLVLLLLAIAAPVSAQAPMDFLGVSMGSPPPFPECKIAGPRSYPMYQSLVMMTGKPCWMHDMVGPRPGSPISEAKDGKIRLALLSDALPSGLTMDRITATVIDGNVEEIVATTRGNQYQAQLLEALVEKYGQPTVQASHAMSNAMGASFNAVNASWDLAGLTVNFIGIGSRIDNGVITVRTPKGKQHVDQVRAEEEASKPRF